MGVETNPDVPEIELVPPTVPETASRAILVHSYQLYLADPEEPPTPAVTSLSPKFPSWSSFLTTIFYAVLTVTTFTIVLPTGPAYMESFGVSVAFVGYSFGMTPMFSALMQPLVFLALRAYPLKRILIGFCLVNIVGSCLYSLANGTDQVATVLISRAISGAVGGPAVGPHLPALIVLR